MDVELICAVVFAIASWSLLILYILRVFIRAHSRWCPKCKGKLRMLSIDDLTAIITEQTDAGREAAKLGVCIYGMARGPVYACAKCRAWWSAEMTR